MRTPLLTALILALLPVSARAQRWTQQYPPQLPDARDVAVLAAFDVWVALADGTLRHTVDGGVNWSDVATGASQLEAVEFASGSLGWAAGDGIWRTTDAGQTWEQVHTAGVRALSFDDPQNAAAVTQDDRVLFSVDAGLTWVDRGPLPGSPELLDVQCLGAGLAWTSGAAGALFSTTDGGANWTPRDAGSGQDLGALWFVDGQHGWLTAGSRLLHTQDGGLTWSPQATPTNSALTDVFFLTAQRGWACGRGGALLSTSDAGASWSSAPGGEGTDLAALAFADFFGGYSVGVDGRVFASQDGGASWSRVAGGTPVSLPTVYGLSSVDEDHAWAATTDDEILRTTDGGANWTPVSAGVNFQWFDVSFVDALNGYACGKRQAFFPSMAVTHDGGLSWNTVSYGLMVDFLDVETLDANTALVTGSTFVWRTTDGGQNWPSVTLQPFGTYYGMDFVDTQRGWVAGSQVFRTDDGGASWTHLLTVPAAETAYDVGFATAQVGWLVGEAGSLRKTTDGGATWTLSNLAAAPGDLHGLSVVDQDQLWVVGDGGFVARSSDGGLTWTVESLAVPAGAALRTVAFAGPEKGWLGGIFDVGVWGREALPDCPAPSAYCVPKVNSAGGACNLFGVGEPSASGAGFSVALQGALPGAASLLVYSETGPAAAPFLGGTRCLAFPLRRTPVFFSDANGAGARSVDVPADWVGRTRWYQLFYRDASHPDGTGFGMSDGLAVTFCD